MRDPLLAVCNQFNYPLISQADFDMIDVLLSIINAFRGFMLKLQQQSIPTILLVLPGVDGLIRLLETLKTEEKLPGVCQALIDSMEKRFSDVLKSGEQAGNPVYLDAAVLDPIVQKRDGYLDDNFALALSAIRAVVSHLLSNKIMRQVVGFFTRPHSTSRSRTCPLLKQTSLKSGRLTDLISLLSERAWLSGLRRAN